MNYASRGYQFFAPGCIVSECLYVLAEKVDRDKTLTPPEHAAALADLCTYMGMLLPPPSGDFSLTARSEQIRSGYGASRSADGVFIALAEELQQPAQRKSSPSMRSSPNRRGRTHPLFQFASLRRSHLVPRRPRSLQQRFLPPELPLLEQ